MPVTLHYPSPVRIELEPRLTQTITIQSSTSLSFTISTDSQEASLKSISTSAELTKNAN